MKRLILASLAVAALASCSKESTEDVAITSSKTQMEFTTYASTATAKGTPVNSNSDFKGTNNLFSVSAYFTATSSLNSGKYFSFSDVKYIGSTWVNQSQMYYPNESGTLYFGAYYPSDDTKITSASYEYNSGHDLSFDYTVADAVTSQRDVMYAIKDYSYTSETEDSINLHFKHALTQIAFTATKDSDIDVTVTGISICNVNEEGTFSASVVTDDSGQNDETIASANVDTDNFGEWKDQKTAQNYAAVMTSDEAITVTSDTDATALSNSTDALMLIPQELTAWDTDEGTTSDTGSYLAIKCKISHAAGDDTVGYASIVDGIVFVPFDTDNIKYAEGDVDDGWRAGYKITYNLHFGGGYTYPDGGTIPEPGTVPDPDDVVETLRTITYTTSVDEWVPASGSTSATVE
ncbi:MAG: fimbrillin family protein [Rikenellaceae bacterium]